MSDKVQVDSIPLSSEEIKDVKNFYSNPKEHKTGTLKELLEELHRD